VTEVDPEREHFRAFVMDRQHEGEAALIRGDVGPRLEMWSHRDPVTLFAAVGPTKAGWSELEFTFRAVASRPRGQRRRRERRGEHLPILRLSRTRQVLLGEPLGFGEAAAPQQHLGLVRERDHTGPCRGSR